MVKFRLSSSVILLILTVLGLGLRLATAVADPFLHPWDERFHALVARNMIAAPWTPRLRPGMLLPFDYSVWCCNDIWLHKQPLFLWQMALSMKVFGVGLLQMRLPSVLLSSLMIPVLYHMAQLTGLSRRISLIAAGFLAFNSYHIELSCGYYGMDHNDVAFSFYILLSSWAFLKYRTQRTVGWALLTGALAAAAVLCKWLVGLVVLAVWGTDIFRENDRATRKASAIRLLQASFVAVAISLPWQLYILHKFPAEARYEYAFNMRHLAEVIEGQGGSWSFYLERFPQYFGNVLFLLVPAGLVLPLFSARWRTHGYGLLCTLFAAGFCFYSFLPATKVQSFMAPFLPPALILSATSFCLLVDWLRARQQRMSLLFAAAGISFAGDQAVQLFQHHAPGNPERIAAAQRTNVYRSLSRYLSPGTRVVMIVPEREDIDVMFFNPGIIAHSWVPSPEEFRIYTRRGVRVAYFASANGYSAPAYLRNYWNAYRIPIALK